MSVEVLKFRFYSFGAYELEGEDKTKVLLVNMC